MNDIRLLTPAEWEKIVDRPEAMRRIGQATARRLATLWRSGHLTGGDLTATLPHVWWQSLYPLSWVPAATWAEMFDEAGYTSDAEPADRPTQPVTLYRGIATCRNARRAARKHTGLLPQMGWSWTDDPDEATSFAEARATDDYAGPWAVYRIDATPQALLGRISINNEWVVHTGRLTEPPATAWTSTDQ